mgnify:CR=1 FL=1
MCSSDLGELGKKLRKNIKENTDSGDLYEQHGFILNGHRCPFLCEDGLCELIIKLGQDSLCEVCKNTPRNYLEYGKVREISVSASCPEAARLIYASDEKMRFTSRQTKEDFPFEEDDEEIALSEFIREARDRGIEILQDRDHDIKTRMGIFLSYAGLVQQMINENNYKNKNITIEKIENKYNFNDDTIESDDLYEAFLLRLRTYSGLASIGEAWRTSVRDIYQIFAEGKNEEECPVFYKSACADFDGYMASEGRMYEYEHHLVYYAFLLLSRCVDDMDFYTKARLVVLGLLFNRDMDMAIYLKKRSFEKSDRETNARIYAREVEHSEENLTDLYEEILFEKALLDIFTKKM